MEQENISKLIPVIVLLILGTIEAVGGLYFVNSDTTQDELVSRNKAILYGFIF